jgi:hypothetical protein
MQMMNAGAMNNATNRTSRLPRPAMIFRPMTTASLACGDSPRSP